MREPISAMPLRILGRGRDVLVAFFQSPSIGDADIATPFDGGGGQWCPVAFPAKS